MCLDANETEQLRLTLEKMKTALSEAGFVALSPNRTDDAGRRDDDFQPLNEMNQVLQSSKNRHRKEILSHIEAALARFEDEPEMVGLCEACEECIGKRRLEIFPYVLYCVRCQEAQENERSFRSGRRHLTDYKS